MEAGQKPSICWGQRRRHLSLGVPHSFYFYLRPVLSFQPFFHRPLIPLTRSAPDIGQSPLSSIFSLSLLSQLYLFYITLPLDALSLCVQHPPKHSSVDPPCLFSCILLHHPCFSNSVILFPSLLLPPCLELLVVLRSLAPSPSAAICFGLSANQPAGQHKAFMFSSSVLSQHDLNGYI